jgi:uncharacterized membrane protein YuzA (DUF378 family)
VKKIDILATVLLVVGGLNWGLVSLAKFDLVATLDFGQTNALTRVVYGLVGLSAIYLAIQAPSLSRRWTQPARTPVMAG